MSAYRSVLAPAVVLGMGFLSLACGRTGSLTASGVPAAGEPSLIAVTGSVAASSDTNSAPIAGPAPCGVLTLTNVAEGPNWVRVQVEWLRGSEKAVKSACPVPAFSVTPRAKMVTPRYDPNQVTLWSTPGIYTVTAVTADSKPVSLKVRIKGAKE